jgi:6,7-dimethyl-8-ribityllumazine synthase
MELQGSRQARGRRFAIVVSRFNESVCEGLLRGACAVLKEAGADDADVTVVRVPGAFELPLAARVLAAAGTVDAVICLGCVIKGETMHFEYISSAVSHGIMAVAADTRIPVTFGVLTTLTDAQAEARSADNADNKGREAALAAVEMVSLVDEITQRSGR